MKVMQISDVVGAKKKEIRLPNKITYFYIAETSGNTLYYSFDGTNFTTVPANSYRELYSSFENPIDVDEFYVKANTTTTFEIVVMSESNVH